MQISGGKQGEKTTVRTEVDLSEGTGRLWKDKLKLSSTGKVLDSRCPIKCFPNTRWV